MLGLDRLFGLRRERRQLVVDHGGPTGLVGLGAAPNGDVRGIDGSVTIVPEAIFPAAIPESIDLTRDPEASTSSRCCWNVSIGLGGGNIGLNAAMATASVSTRMWEAERSMSRLRVM